MKKHIPTTLQAGGTIILVVSLLLLSAPLGIGFAGVSLIAFGIAAERGV
jgi:hypothetical protein